jgi:hypothetical protein
MPFIDYYTKLGKINYDVLGDGTTKLATNIMSRARFKQVSDSNATVYYTYTVKDYETPETLAFNYYGDSGLHWIIILSNDIYNLYTDWVKSSPDFYRFLIKKYGADLDPIQKANWTIDELKADPSVVHHFQDYLGNYIDITAYEYQFINNPDDTKPEYVTYFDYEDQRNESLRNIRLPRKEFATIIDQQMNDLFFKR